jgi:adenylate cyclase
MSMGSVRSSSRMDPMRRRGDVMAVLRDYHAALGTVIHGFEATVGPLVEDRLAVHFNDPLPCDDPAGQAVSLALAMRERMAQVLPGWRKAGYVLDFGPGIDLGYATLGTTRPRPRVLGSPSRPMWRPR